MNRYAAYMQYKKGEMSLSQLSEALSLTDRDMKFRLSRHGTAIKGLLKVLDKIEKDEITRGEAAQALGVGERQVNQLMDKWSVSRPLREYVVTRAVSKVKWEIRKKWAIDYIADDMTIEDAAEAAAISSRMMRRWVSELLDKHYGMVFKDLKSLSGIKRKRLADEIETAEGLELSKQQVLQDISNGAKTIHDEALDRVLSKRSTRRKHV